jgi:glycerol-3-phosphate dehydrogenase (NAD(P)+)
MFLIKKVVSLINYLNSYLTIYVMKVAVYGVGNFGYAILKHLDRKRNKEIDLFAYDRNPSLIEHLNKHREHLFLHRGVKISKRVNFTHDVSKNIQGAEIIILCVTSDSTKDVLKQMRPYLKQKPIILNTAKALDFESGRRLSEVAAEALKDIDYTYALLAGGTIAQDLFKNEPLGVSIASKNEKSLRTLYDLFESENLFVYPTKDLEGTEYASAFKNVISILAGIINGKNFSYGSETHFISRASDEVRRLVVEELGGRDETFTMSSQSWGNDLWLSCTGNTRNRDFGKLIGKGSSPKEALEIMNKNNKTVEGLNTLMALKKILGADLDNFPILEAVYNIVILEKPLLEILRRISGGRNSGIRVI